MLVASLGRETANGTQRQTLLDRYEGERDHDERVALDTGTRAILTQRAALESVSGAGVLAPELLWFDDGSENPFGRRSWSWSGCPAAFRSAGIPSRNRCGCHLHEKPSTSWHACTPLTCHTLRLPGLGQRRRSSWLPGVDEPQLVKRYGERAGIEIDPQAWHWYRVFSYLRLAFYHLAGPRAFDAGHSDDLRLAALRLALPVTLDRLSAALVGDEVA